MIGSIKKAFGLFVQMDSPFKDTMEYGSLKLFVSEKVIDMNQHGNREQSAVVTHSNFKNINIGDTVWFSHNITTGHKNRLSVKTRKQKNNVTSNHFCLDEESGLYFIPYTENKDGSPIGVQSLAYAVKNKDGVVKSLDMFLFGTPYHENETESIKDMWIPSQREKGFELESKVKYTNDYVENIFDIHKGDILGLVDYSNYEMNIDGETVWRFPTKNVAYKRVGDEFFGVGAFMIVEKHKEPEMTSGGLYVPESARKEKDTATVIHCGNMCSETNVGDTVFIHKKAKLGNLYDNIYVVDEAGCVPQYFLKAIDDYVNSRA